VAAALLGAAVAQPEARCSSELLDLTIAQPANGAAASAAACAALAAFEGCIVQVTSRPIQSALEIELNNKQLLLPSCVDTPKTAAIRTERDALDITGREIIFHRTVRQDLNLFELRQSVETNTASLSTAVSAMHSAAEANTAALSATISRVNSAAASQGAAMDSTLTARSADMDSTLRAASAASALALAATDGRTATLSTALQALAASTAPLNASIAAALAAASNAATPQVYIQWGSRACTAPGGVTTLKLYDGITYGTRHNYNGGGGNQLCLKNANGDQGGQRQGGEDSNDMMVPMRREHSNYNNLPSRRNIFRAKDGWIIPCAKCKYAKSCFEESGVAECPTGYHKMYTGYLHAGHQGHHGNNNRICVDKNPADSDYTSGSGWDGHLYPTIARDGSSAGPRSGRIVLACHMCCVA
jgi:hypothetical protein